MTKITKMILLQILSWFSIICSSWAVPQDDINLGSPLFLTPYIESSKTSEGRKLSEVILPYLDFHVKSYSGYLTINKTHNSNSFFWFFPAKNGQTKNVPLILWLNGGPGASSVSTVFVQHGPFEVVKSNGKFKLQLHNYTWIEEFAVLFIDNPVGTGFSFTDNESHYLSNESEVGHDVYEALRQFFILFNEYRGNPFYVTGVSYGGKYVPAVAYKIHTMGDQAKKNGINLKGLSIGNGLCDPRSQSNYGDFLWKLGLIDKHQRDHFLTEEEKIVKLIGQKEYTKAVLVMNELFLGFPIPGHPHPQTYFKNVTGINSIYNLNEEFENENLINYLYYLSNNATRKALHVGNQKFVEDSRLVFTHMLNDIYNSTKSWIEELLNANYRIIFYNGNLDIIVAATLTENFLNTLKWNKANKFYSAERKIWKVAKEDRSVAGYVKRVDNLYFAVVRNAGHAVTADQPRAASDLITRFIKEHDF